METALQILGFYGHGCWADPPLIFLWIVVVWVEHASADGPLDVGLWGGVGYVMRNSTHLPEILQIRIQCMRNVALLPHFTSDVST